jgi:hypothetical protein
LCGVTQKGGCVELQLKAQCFHGFAWRGSVERVVGWNWSKFMSRMNQNRFWQACWRFLGG